MLARIDNKHAITLKDFNDRLENLPKRYQLVINKNKKEFLDELIIDTLLYNEALKKNLDRDKETERMVEEARRKILIARLLKEDVYDKVDTTDSEIENYYNANKESFKMPEALRASHILVKSEGEAQGIKDELARGAKFEDLARERSIDPTARVGGDIGYFTRYQLVPEFEEAAFKMQVGEISGPVETKFGYHVIKLTERRQSRVKELGEVRESIKQSLERMKKRRLFSEYAESLKAKAKIAVNDKLLESISQEESPGKE